MSLFQQKRKQARKSLMYYLEVIDMDSNQLLGRLVDVTTNGLLMVGESELAANTRYRISITLPEKLADKETITLNARCVRSQKDPHSRYYYSGLQFEKVDPDDADIIDLLITRYEF